MKGLLLIQLTIFKLLITTKVTSVLVQGARMCILPYFMVSNERGWPVARKSESCKYKSGKPLLLWIV